MARKKASVVDEATGELLGQVSVSPEQRDGSPLLFMPPSEEPAWETAEEAMRAVRDQRLRCDRLEAQRDTAKAEAKSAATMLEDEESRLRWMQRKLGQMKLFRGLLLLVGLLLALSSCGVSLLDQDPLGSGAPGGWEDLPRRVDDFHVLIIEPGVGLLIDRKTNRGWILAGSTQSWQAVEPIGGL
jgi:hypothetical protein